MKSFLTRRDALRHLALGGVAAISMVSACAPAAPAQPTAAPPAPSAAAPAASPASSPAASPVASPPAASAAPGQTRLVELKMGVPARNIASAVYQVVKDAGIFAQNGLDVTVTIVGATAQVLEGAMISGEVPITSQASPAVIQADLAGLDLAMFCGVINTTFFSIVSKKEITKPEDLKGKTIGDSGPGSNDRAAGQYGLAKFGLKLGTDVTPITIQGGQAAQLAALQAGGIDAAVLAPPSTYLAEKQGFNQILDLGAVGLDFQSGALTSSRRYIAANRDTILRFARSISQGIYFYKTQKRASIATLTSFIGETDPDILERSYNDFALKYTVKVPRPTLNGIQFVIDNVVPDPKVKDHKPAEYVDLSFVDQLEAEGLYKQLWGDNTSGT